MAEPYTTSVYPYPAEMWNEAAAHLANNRGWSTILVAAPPTNAEAENTAVQEMASRGIENAHALVVSDVFAGGRIIRISRLQYIDPRWDDVEHHLLNHALVSLITIDTETTVPTEVMDEARAAMAERGLNVGVGFSADPLSLMGVLRIERA